MLSARVRERLSMPRIKRWLSRSKSAGIIRAAAYSRGRAFKTYGAVIDCTIRNITDRGACLEVASPIGIPASFDLMLDQRCVRDCRVTWRKATRIGVAFA